MSYMFAGCEKLTTIPQMDISSATNVSSMFSYCRSLTNLDLRNIKLNLQIGSGTSWGHLLTVDSLVNTIKELMTQTSYKTLTMGTANLKKIVNLYCKIIDDTDPKKTMELCESTEEGAMTLTDYAQLKKWNIKYVNQTDTRRLDRNSDRSLASCNYCKYSVRYDTQRRTLFSRRLLFL